MSIHASVLVTLEMDEKSFATVSALRSRYFPLDRNIVPAHISLLHSLPGEEIAAISTFLHELATSHELIPLRFAAMKRLGKGMAIEINSPDLLAVHSQLTREFVTWLTPQDRQPFRPHVTLMNKAEPYQAALAFTDLAATWESFSGSGTGLLLWEYLGGPWKLIERFSFASNSGMMNE